MPKISVVIPIYNRASFIVETLRSVEGQTLVPLEVLVVDDHSTDDSAEVVREFAKSSPLVVVLLTNLRQKGVGGAMNFGIENAKGEYIAFLDSDDLWAPSHLQQLAEALACHLEYDIAFSKSQVFGPAKDAPQKNVDFAISIARCLEAAFDKRDGSAWLSNKRLLYSLMRWGVPFRCPASLVRKALFSKSQLLFDESIAYSQDAQFMTEIAYYTGFIYIDNTGFFIRRHLENDGDLGYGDKIWQSYEKRVVRLKRYFKGKELSILEKGALRHLLTGLQTYVLIAKTKKCGFLCFIKESAILLRTVPSFSTALLILKLFLKLCFGIIDK